MSDHGEIRALSLYQPWAQAVSIGLKRYETRSWATRYRGLLLIHASKRWTTAEDTFWASSAWHLQTMGVDPVSALAYAESIPPLGCIVAIADLVECYHAEDLVGLSCRVLARPDVTDTDRLFGDWTHGRFAWQLENVIALPEPVPCKGAQGLWAPPAEVLDVVASLAKPL